MGKYVVIIIFLAVLPGSCHENDQHEKAKPEEVHFYKPSFTSFEMSFRGGWVGGFSFRVDSNKVFIAPSIWAQLLDSVGYGLLPDSICNLIDTGLFKIRNDKSIASTKNLCDDCDQVSIRAVDGNDSIKLFQMGKISEPVYKLIDGLHQFLKAKKYNYYNMFTSLETAREIAPPLPPKIHK
jgi:hypothetical protein